MNIEELAEELAAAKEAEARAKDLRISIEEQIDALVEGKQDGNTTVDAGRWKLTVRRGWTFHAEAEKIEEIAPSLIKVKKTLDEPAYKRLASSNAELYNEVAQFVEAKPRKAAVVLKEKGDEDGI